MIIQLIGICEDEQYEVWKNLTLAAIKSVPFHMELEEINSIDRIINLELSAIPALLINNSILLEQNTHAPSIVEIKIAIQEHLTKQSIHMKNIIVPTDFSDTAKNAFLYAKNLAKEFSSKLKLVHVCHPNTDASTYGISIPNIGELLEIRQSQLDKFIHQDEKDDLSEVIETSMYDQEVYIGYAGDELVRISKEENVDLLLMGTTGKGGLLENMFGSVSTHVSQKAHCPVWLIPPQAKYTGIKNILYASNYESADEIILHKISQFANLCKANVHLVHVNESKKEGDYKFEELILKELFEKKAPALDFKMSTIQSDKVWEGIDEYSQENNIDLVVIVTQHRNLWERITHKSITKEMVLHASLPLLVLHSEK